MRINEISQHIDFSSLIRRDDLSRSALNALKEAIDHGHIANFLEQDGTLDEYSRDGLVSILEFRSRNLAKQGRECYGFSEAISAVRNLSDSDRVSWMAIRTATHVLVILIEINKFDVIGCISLKTLDKKKIDLPRNWDGVERK